MLSTPRATFIDDTYRFDYSSEQVSVLMERIAEKRGAGAGIVCELTVESAEATSAGLLYSGNFNLLTNNASLANKLRDRRDDVDWDGMLTQVAAIAKKRYREGEPVIDLATVEPDNRARWLIPGFIEDTTRPTLVAAGGGTGKSTIGLAAALTVSSGLPFLGLSAARHCPVLYMDWEADAEIHAERAQALWRGLGREDLVPTQLLFYQRQVSSLHEGVANVRKRIAEEGIGFAILDSVGMARGGAPEDAEQTIKLFVANRKLGIPVLAIDHVSKEVLSNPKARKTAIGSVYTENNVCRVWVMKGEETSQDTISVSLTDVKRNNTRQQPSLAYHVRFEDDGTDDQRPVSVRYERATFSDLPTATQPGGQKWQMAAVIRESGGHPVPVAEIAAALNVTDGTVRTMLRRHGDLFVRQGDGIALTTEEDFE